MSNLGYWQKLIELASKAGGPRKLLGKVALAGVAVGGVTTLGVQGIIKKIVKKSSEEVKSPEFTTFRELVLSEHRSLKQGETFRLLLRDGDTAIIQLTKEPQPYAVEFSVLVEASDVPASYEDNAS